MTLWKEIVPLERIVKRTSLLKNSVYKIWRHIYEQGYGANNDFNFRDEYLCDVPQSGCPRVIEDEKES
jgi:hypothetical protein